MRVFDRIGSEDHEQVVFLNDRSSGLRAIVAIHSTRLGPALGGTRFYPYANEDDALEDVLRLARGMTYKAAAAGLDLGGGKAVIIGNPTVDRSEALLRTYARFVHSLSGRYITAEDVGTTQADMDLVRRETPYVTGVSRDLGGSGDPSAATAAGIMWAMRSVARRLWSTSSLEGRHVAVTGVGKVGSNLVRHLVAEQARVTVADVTPAAIERVTEEHGHNAVATCPADEIHAVPCDVFAPCALGGILNTTTIPELRTTAIVGSANNQLADPSCAKLLSDAGILYVPDYIANAGGLINIAEEMSPRGYNPERAMESVSRILDTTNSVLDTAQAESILTTEAADRVAERRIDQLGNVARIRTSAGRRGRAR